MGKQTLQEASAFYGQDEKTCGPLFAP